MVMVAPYRPDCSYGHPHPYRLEVTGFYVGMGSILYAYEEGGIIDTLFVGEPDALLRITDIYSGWSF